MMNDTWTQRLWADVEEVYQAILAHPFLAGLTDGTLGEEQFAYYIAQDAHYLREYARALAVVGAKAPTHPETAVFATHAAGTAKVEMALHETPLPQLGITPRDLAAVPMSPTNARRSAADATPTTSPASPADTPAAARQQPGEPGEQRPIRPGQLRARHLTAQHGNLVTQHQNLGVLHTFRAPQQDQPPEPSPHRPTAPTRWGLSTVRCN